MKTTFRRLGAAARALALMAGFIAASQTAHAACTGPAGDAGDMIYASNYNTMAFCNGTAWTSMAGGVSVTVNTAGGGATPAGSSADVQFNSSGALAADTGNFTYASGLLKAPNISTTAITASGQGTFNTLLVNGGATVAGNASLTTISTSLIQVGNSGASCTSGLTGGIRYNSTSNTIDYCSGSAWLSLGPSATVVPAFRATKNGTNQTMSNAVTTKVTFSTTEFDTNNDFDTANSRFQPTIPGYYLITGSIQTTTTAANQYLCTYIVQNGSTYRSSNCNSAALTGAGLSVPASAILYFNGAGDYVELYANDNATALTGVATWTFFTGSLLTMNGGGGGGGGTATPAGSTNDVQFNSGGLLAADTGNFTYASSTLTAPAISTGGFTATGVASITTVSASVISSTYVQLVSGSALACTGGTAGAIRYSDDSLQLCGGSGWTTLGSGSPIIFCRKTGTANFGTGTGSYSFVASDCGGTLPDATYYGTLSNLNVCGGSIVTSVRQPALGSSPGVGWYTSTGCSGTYELAATYVSKFGTGDVSATTGGTSGDRITSGTLSIIANTGSAYASLTTNGITWGYLSGNASFIPEFQVNDLNAGNVSSSLVQVGSNSATCGASLYGTMRWNATSDTIQICNSGGWTSVASSSVPNTTISQGQNNYAAIFSGPNTLVTDSALYIDRATHRLGVGTATPVGGKLQVGSTLTFTDNWPAIGFNFDLNTSKYLTSSYASAIQQNNLVGSLMFSIWPSSTAGTFVGTANVMALTSSGVTIGNATVSPTSSLTVQFGEVQVGSSGGACVSATNGGAIRYASGSLYYCNGSNAWTAIGGGGGSPAGSTGDIQFNTSGSFDADTGNLFWDKANHRLGIGTNTPSAAIQVSGGLSVGTASNTLYQPNGQTLQVNGGNATARIILDSTALGSTPSYLAANGSYLNLGFYESTGAVPVMSVQSNTNVGIGTTVPSATLHVMSAGTPYAMFGPSGTGAIELRKDDNASGFFIRNDGVNPVISTKVGNMYFGYGGHSGMALNFYTSNTFAGTWDPNGRLGIGTGSPAYTLDVSGFARVRNPSASQVMIDTTATGQQAALGFYSNGTNKWQIGKNNGDQFFVWDSVAARTAMNIYSNGSMGLMPDSGNVGIGTYTPGSRFDVSSTSMRLSTTGGSNTPYMEWYKDGARQAYIGWGAPGSGFNVTTESNNPLYINASQTTVSGQLYAANDILLNNATNNVVFYGSTGVAVPGANSNGEKIQLYGTAGTVGASDYAIGIESGTMWFNGSAYKWYAGAVQKMLLDASGNLTATAFLYSSDKRLKSDITNLTGGLAKLDGINPVSFRFTADPSKTIHLGLIAQDVQKVYPEAVHKDDKGFLKLDYPALVGPIIDMLKELKVIVLGDHDDIAKLQAANDVLQQEVRALHAANDNLEAANRSLKTANDIVTHRLYALEGKQRAHGW